jgi:hypothetical protein
MPFKPFVSAPLTTLSDTSVIAAKRAFELAVLTYIIRSNITLIHWRPFMIQQVSEAHSFPKITKVPLCST